MPARDASAIFAAFFHAFFRRLMPPQRQRRRLLRFFLMLSRTLSRLRRHTLRLAAIIFIDIVSLLAATFSHYAFGHNIDYFSRPTVILIESLADL